ncbi:MAG: hypothetical protein CMF51_00715 [Legionellales bacterium]|nr:hypothetical protein [Legionellales bacterium]|tara:strand:+ start:214 stop:522 length:309 start_codon:yes stop_codon:yes gene_type:complete
MYSDSTYPQSPDELTEFLSEKQHDHRLHPNHVQRVVTDLTPLYNAALESPDGDTIKMLAMNYLDVIESLNVEHEALKSEKPDSIRTLEEGFRQYHAEMQHAV